MKSNDDYLNELLESMNKDNIEEMEADLSTLSSLEILQSGFEEDTIDNDDMALTASFLEEENNLKDVNVSMLDTLTSVTQEEKVNYNELQSLEILETEMMESEIAEPEISETKMMESEIAEPEMPETKMMESEIAESEISETEMMELEMEESEIIEPELKDNDDVFSMMDDNDESDPSSMLARLMAEMQEELQDDKDMNFDDSMFTEEGLDELLNAAQNDDSYVFGESSLSYEIQNNSELAEIEALLDLSENNQVLDENQELLRLLQTAEGETSFSTYTKEKEDVDLEKLDALLTPDSDMKDEGVEDSGKDIKKKKKKEKKPREKKIKEKKVKEKKQQDELGIMVEKTSGLKDVFSKIFAVLMEEVPEDEEPLESDSLNLSDENKEVLNQLDQEKEKKVKVKEKKAKKEKEPKVKKEKETKPKKEKPKKEPKPKKEKIPAKPEKKLPRKKVRVVKVLAASILVLILLVVYLVPSMISVGRARVAFDKGNYYEAYKEYYGQKLSEEDEKRFQGATTIMRLQSNLDGYYNYSRLNKEIYALHSLVEAVEIKFDVFLKAEEYEVLEQVSGIYNEILNVLDSQYHMSEEDAMDLAGEESDVTYTQKLQYVVEHGEYVDVFTDMDQSDLLPEEELLLNP